MAAGVAAALLLGGGTILNVMSQLSQGSTAERLAEREAEQARMQGREREKLIRKSGARAKGRLRAAIGKSGVTLEGSPMDALAESAMNIEMDAINARYGAESQAQATEFEGQARKRASRVGAAASLLSGTGQTIFTGHQLGAF